MVARSAAPVDARPCRLPSFETRRKDAALLRMRSAFVVTPSLDGCEVFADVPQVMLLQNLWQRLHPSHVVDLSQRSGPGRVDEIERFRREIVERTGDPRAGEKITDQELLREVMNTVGKLGQLGGSIRCVVSVSMLTPEGWDTRKLLWGSCRGAEDAPQACHELHLRGCLPRSWPRSRERLVEQTAG